MKKLFSLVPLLTRLKFTIVFLLCLAVIGIAGQKPTEPIKLSPAASAEWMKIEVQQAELVRVYNELAERKRLLTIDIPAGWIAKPEAGIVVFYPQPTPSPKEPK